MSDAECAERIRLQYLGQLRQDGDLQAGLLHRIAADVAVHCGVSLLKAHRLAWGWTVAQAVEAFHRMCRREKIKPRGLTTRSWMDWEAGARPNGDYQDLLSRLFQASPVRLGWAADYAPAGPAASRSALGLSQARASAGTSVAQVDGYDGRRGHSLLHLPPDIRDFNGRAEQVGQVTREIAAAVGSAQTALPIVCLSGQPGVGKTTLAIHVAHRIGEEFPDGQLYTNLRGADARAQDPADVLAGFLRELGVDGADIPAGIDERARMYRAHLAGQRILVMLDNAADEAQVRPLLPGTPGCAVLVTSRSRMTALAGSRSVSLDVMPPDQAAELLTAIIGTDRAGAEPEAVAEIGKLCGYLPLALRIAGARLLSRPAWNVSWFAARLRDESRRLDLLKAGDLEVRASFALSYDSRDETEQLAFRMLGLLAADFAAWNLAALIGTGADEAERLLEQLADAVLVDITGVDTTGLIRYRLHDLLRDFARECLHATETPDARLDSLARLADQYIGAMQLASALVHPGEQGSTGQPGQPLLAEDVVRGDPWRWLAAERANLVALVEQVHAAGLRDRAWRLAETLPAMSDWRADWRAWERTHQLALDATRHEANANAEARILRSLGALYRELGRYDEAVTLLTQAAAIFAGRGDRHQWATAMRNLGDTYRYQGRLAAAIDAFSAGLAVFREAADTRSVAGALNGLADAYRGLSRWDEAGSAFRACIDIYRDLSDPLEEARAKIRYSLVFRDQHLSQQAIPLITEGLEVARQFGDRRWEARAMRQLAIVHRNDGDTDTAITTFADCLSIFGELEDRRGVAVVLRNRGDAYRLAGRLPEAADDLSSALESFEAIGDRRWTARSRMSIAGLYRVRHEWASARTHLDAALAAFRAIGDRAAEARALRELGILLRDQGERESSGEALNASQAIFGELGDTLWTARVLASQAVLEGLRGNDPAPLMREATDTCRQHGITAQENITSALREW
ncbi:MAG: tetratricopeptide repeat protein [Streptosporangiaceae bacterium]